MKEIHLQSTTFPISLTICGHGGRAPLLTSKFLDVTCEHCQKLYHRNGPEWQREYEQKILQD